MRIHGTISDWKDGQGFGFITPDEQGERVFVHQSALLDRTRQPDIGARVTYELAPHKKRRVCASNVAYAMHGTNGGGFGSGLGGAMSWFALGFLALLAAVTFKGHLPAAVLALYLLESAISYIFHALDKSASQGGRWRIPESTLHLFNLIGGWPGGLLAQKRLRHKTNKESFQIVFWLTVFLNSAGLAWLFSADGQAFLLRTF